jgi:hypothetical protein
LTGYYPVDGHYHFGAGRIFGDITVGSAPQHLIHIGPLCLHRYADDLDIGIESADGPGSFHAIDRTHMDIHQYDVRLEFPGCFDGLLAIGALRYYSKSGDLAEHPAPGFPYVKMIVDDNKVDHGRFFGQCPKLTFREEKKSNSRLSTNDYPVSGNCPLGLLTEE